MLATLNAKENLSISLTSNAQFIVFNEDLGGTRLPVIISWNRRDSTSQWQAEYSTCTGAIGSTGDAGQRPLPFAAGGGVGGCLRLWRLGLVSIEPDMGSVR